MERKEPEMEFETLIKERYSCRNMDAERPVEQEKLQKIAEAARVSPSACNLQRQRLKIVTSPEGIQKLRQCTPCHFEAPAVIILSLCKDTADAPMDEASGYKFGLIDIGIAVAHMSLQAQELGLGNTIVGMFDEEKLRSAFQIPQEQLPVLLLPVGYPGEKGGPCILHKTRRPLEETVEFDF